DGGYAKDLAGESVHRLARRRASHVADPGAAPARQVGELGILSEELVQSRIDTNAPRQGVPDRGTAGWRQCPAVRGDADDEVVGPAGGADRLFQVPHDRDAAGDAIQDLPRVAVGQVAVNDRRDTVAIAVADEPVRRLAVGGAEASFAEDHRGPVARPVRHPPDATTGVPRPW